MDDQQVSFQMMPIFHNHLLTGNSHLRANLFHLSNTANSMASTRATSTQGTSAAFGALPSDPISMFLDNPFKDWATTLLFVVLLAAFCAVAVLLGIRYMEVLQINMDNSSKTPLTLEAQRFSAGEITGGNERYHHEQGSILFDHGFQRDQEFATRHRSRPRYVQPAVAIGEVREGRIAQRRASSSRRDENRALSD